jgi:hypothetical protein
VNAGDDPAETRPGDEHDPGEDQRRYEDVERSRLESADPLAEGEPLMATWAAPASPATSEKATAKAFPDTTRRAYSTACRAPAEISEPNV